MIVMLAVAVACAIWTKLPVAVKAAIVGVPLSVLMFFGDGLLDTLIGALLPPYGSERRSDGQKHVIKWRRRGKDTSE